MNSSYTFYTLGPLCLWQCLFTSSVRRADKWGQKSQNGDQCSVYLTICSTGPLIFSHPSASLLKFQLILLKKSATTDMGFNLYPNIRDVYLYQIWWIFGKLPKRGGGHRGLTECQIVTDCFGKSMRKSASWKVKVSPKKLNLLEEFCNF